MALVELTLSDFGRALRAYWWMLGVLTILIGGAGIGYVMRMPDIYRATALLAVNSGESYTNSGVTEALGGISALVGLPSTGAYKDRAVSLATLRSKASAREFIETLNLMPILYADEWGDQISNVPSSGSQTRNNLWDAERLLRRQIIAISEDRDTGLINLTISWTDPEPVVSWVNSYVDLVNRRLKTEALRRSHENVEYLRGRLVSEGTLEIRQAASALLASELKSLMLAESTTDQTFEVIDPPYQPNRPEAPNRLILSVASIVLGLLVGVLAIVLVAASPKRA